MDYSYSTVVHILSFRIQKDINERLSTLEEALSAKVKFEEEIIDMTRQLCVCQEELKIANRGIGPHPEDAKMLQQKIQVLVF